VQPLVVDYLLGPMDVPIERPDAPDESGDYGIDSRLESEIRIRADYRAEDQPFGFTNDGRRCTRSRHEF
jgi:hypothetical protein